MLEFENQYQHSKQTYLSYQRQSNIIAVFRFVLFVGSIGFLLVAYFQDVSYFYIVSVCMMIAFLICVYLHNRIKKLCLYYRAMSDVYDKHIKRRKGLWDKWEKDGSDFISENENLSLDLDLFGKHSLFQMINVAFTYKGQKALANILLNPGSYEDILKRQKAVQELTKLHELVVQIQTYGEMLTNKNEQDFIEFKSMNNTKKPILSYSFALLTIIALLLSLMNIGVPYCYGVLEAGFVLQICLVFLKLKKNSEMFMPIQQIHQNLDRYKDVFQVLGEASFESEMLKDIQDSLFQEVNVIEGIQELSVISQRVHYRQNIFAFLLLNGLMSFDELVAYQYTKWTQKYSEYIDVWFSQLAFLEALMSLSVVGMDFDDVVMPEIENTNDLSLSFKDLKHPLLKKEKVIGNDFVLQKNVNVITGSNMSGKTTFMRTIALNLVLAYAGGYVFAKQLHCSYMHILTSMRVKDNVEEGISTFYGELLRIKEMIHYSSNCQPMICFIDEIFKGTNSLDRIAGAKATIQKLALPYCLTFLTTHDFELCQIDQVICQNYHFDEYYQDQQIYFDYLIKDGQSTSSNGQFLLKQLGIM